MLKEIELSSTPVNFISQQKPSKKRRKEKPWWAKNEGKGWVKESESVGLRQKGSLAGKLGGLLLVIKLVVNFIILFSSEGRNITNFLS